MTVERTAARHTSTVSRATFAPYGREPTANVSKDTHMSCAPMKTLYDQVSSPFNGGLERPADAAPWIFD